MENSKAFKLIEGTFSISDARSIVLSFYNTKILFHNQQLMRIVEQNEGNAHLIEQKILELDQTRKSILQLLQHETKNDQLLEVEGSIEIRFKDNNG